MNVATPDTDVQLQAAWDAYSRNDLEAALRMAKQALTTAPAHEGALGTIGFLLHATRQYADAQSIFAQLTEIDPHSPDYWMNLGTAQRCAGRPDDALLAFARAATLGANSADFYLNVGLTHIDRKDFESGRVVLAQAIELERDDAEIRYQYALCCYERLRTDDALAALEDWPRLARLSNEVIANIGLLLMKLGDAARAEPAIRQAVAGSPGDPQPLLTLIQLLERTNRLAEALQRMAELEANEQKLVLGSELDTMRAQLAQRTFDHETARVAFSRLLGECQEPELKHLMQFPLAKSLDALGRYDEAFETLEAAHRSQIELLRMTAPVLSARGAPSMLITRYGCSAEDIAAWQDVDAPPPTASPVFIVAFPRSGTTLLELTLDSHPLLVSMDEQPFVQHALDDFVAAGAAYPEHLAALSEADLAHVRGRYWEQVHTKVSLGPNQRLVDKNPLNILRLPAIRRLFPHARIILAIRHPCDVLLSCFMQHFRTPDFALLCSDLDALALGYRRTFDFWYAQSLLLAPTCMELRYETFTEDFQRQVRTVLEFLELPWDDAVLRPQVTALDKGFISTPSYSQVIEPVNRKAVGRWHSYRRHFSRVLPVLAPYLQRWHYEGLGSSNSK